MIYLPKVFGTCRGAQKAIDLALSFSGKNSVYVFKEILHNERVIKTLEKNNIKTIDSLEGLDPKATVVLRAHGEGQAIYDFLNARKIKIADATCPNVAHVHDIVHQKYLEGYKIVIVGKKNHPEVIGTNGWCDNKGILIEDLSDIESADFKEKNYVVAQTTIRDTLFNDVIEKLKELKINFEFTNTICAAQKLIQDEALKLAAQMDIMIVIGGKKSSNTKELYNKCSEVCQTYFFTGFNELKENFPNLNLSENLKIGLTAGASTLKSEVLEIKEKLEALIKTGVNNL